MAKAECSIVLFLIRPRKVCVHGTEYRVNSVVHTGWLDEMPEFSSISKIVVLNSSKVYFVLTKFVTRQFASHFHAFKVCKPARDSSLLLQQSQFKHYLPLHIIKQPEAANGAVYIVPRCNIPEC